MSDMWTVHLRLAHLWFIHSEQRELTQDEWDEFKICMDANMHKAERIQRLKNLSLIASMTNDSEWQHTICASIDKELDRMK